MLDSLAGKKPVLHSSPVLQIRYGQTLVQSIDVMKHINPINLYAFDMNLLVAFEALIKECSVSRAAERIGIGQPAMSHALSRLRDVFKDELFIRTPSGMQPTSRALELAEPIASALDQIRSAIFEKPSFDPKTGRRTFTVGLTDYLETTLLPRLVHTLQREGPGMSVVVRSIDRRRGLEMLDQDYIDLGAGVFPEVSSRHRAKPLFDDNYVCLFNPDHLKFDLPLTLETYLALGHITVSPQEGDVGPVDQILAERGLKRRVVIATPRYMAASFALKETSLMATLPKRIALLCSDAFDLKAVPPPFETSAFEISVVWNRKYDGDAGHTWFRELFCRTAAEAKQTSSTWRRG